MQKSAKKQSGLAAIELTILLPFLLLLIFATAEFGRLLYQYNALNLMARDALRFMVNDVRNGSTGNINVAEASTETLKLFIYSDLLSTQKRLPNIKTDDISFIVDEANDFVTIHIVYNWQPLFYTSLPLFVSSTNSDLSFPLVVNYTMRVF